MAERQDHALTKCPCCNSIVRVIPDEAKLEIVKIAKPRSEERWVPAPRPPLPRRVPLPSPERARARNHTDRGAIAVIERVGAEHGFDLAELRSPQRLPALVKARAAAALAARQETTASLPQIGRILNRHHTTVLHHLAASTPQKNLSESGEGS